MRSRRSAVSVPWNCESTPGARMMIMSTTAPTVTNKSNLRGSKGQVGASPRQSSQCRAHVELGSKVRIPSAAAPVGELGEELHGALADDLDGELQHKVAGEAKVEVRGGAVELFRHVVPCGRTESQAPVPTDRWQSCSLLGPRRQEERSPPPRSLTVEG